MPPLRSIDPATGQLIREYEETRPHDAEEAVRRADRAFAEWRRFSFADRAAGMRRAATILLERREGYAQLMAAEMGKPIAQGRAEIDKCAWACAYFAENAERFLATERVKSDASESFVVFQPLGVVLAIMPWNFPFWQVFRFAAPGLMAGNACVLKHASNVSGSALAIAEVFHDSGFPDGLFSVLLLRSEGVGRVIDAPEIRAVTLTGSAEAGRAVAARAGRALKKTVMELGGSDPYLILDDADLEGTVDACVTSRLINNGESCIAAKRFVVPNRFEERFTALFVERMRAKRSGDPRDETVDIGPLARHDLRDDLHRQVEASVRAGARLLLGGRIPPGPGAYYPPTVLADVRRGMPAYDEELFGPVAAIIGVENEEEAIAVANDTPFGLGAAVFCSDVERAKRVAAERIEAGSCFVNAFVKSDPRLPFGGIKDSGYGRELSSHGIREFVNVKTIYVK